MESNQPQGCLTAILKLFGINLSPTTNADTLPYRLRDDFLSNAELSFYKTLEQALGERAIICAKVNLADIFFVVRPNENQGFRNKIDRKHVDFLICDSTTMKPLYGVELDDSSHSKQKRIERDQFVDSVFRTAGLPLIRIKAARTYDINELKKILDQQISVEPKPSKLNLENTDEAPNCSKCGEKMVERTSTKGGNKGNRFWGCKNFPKCRETVGIG